MKRLRWQLLIIFLTGMVVGILLLNEKPRPTGLVASPEPVKGGIYNEALIGSFQRLNPLLDFYSPADRDVDRLIFSSLVRFDANGVPRPDLAEVWGMSQDGTLYNFTLRDGLKWHDGKPLTADDVVFTVDLMRNGGDVVPKDIQDFWKDIEVKNLSDNTLQFRLPEAFSPFLDYLTFGVLPSHLLKGVTIDQLVDSQFNVKPIGSGPYRFQQFLVENSKVVGVSLAAFDGYYASKPYIQEIIFRYYSDEAAAFKAYKNGNVQGISRVGVETLPSVLAEPNLALYSARLPQCSIVVFNLSDTNLSFFKDAKVRKALLVGLNRQWMVDRILKGQAVLANGPIFPGTWAYYESPEQISFDVDAAKNLLKEAGYVLASEQDLVRKKETVELSFKLTYPNDEQHSALADAIQKDWAKLNVQVELEPVAYETLISERLEQRDFQAVLVDLNLSRTPDPDPYPFWDQGQVTGGQNYSQWDNRLASEYLETARVTLDMTERARLYRSFQVIFRQEWPALPLFYPVYNYAIDRQVQGVMIGPLFDQSDRFNNVVEWHLAVQTPKEPAAKASPTVKP